MGIPSLNLKLEIDTLALVGTALWPVMIESSSTPWSTNFLSATAAPIPLFITILVSLGTCITDLYWNFSFKSATIVFTYCSFALGLAIDHLPAFLGIPY